MVSDFLTGGGGALLPIFFLLFSSRLVVVGHLECTLVCPRRSKLCQMLVRCLSLLSPPFNLKSYVLLPLSMVSDHVLDAKVGRGKTNASGWKNKKSRTDMKIN
jgi:hypothetical protein